MWRNLSEANKYTVYGALFGLCFPLGAIFFLWLIRELPPTENWLTLAAYAHHNSLLYIIDSAPFFLGLFARLAGKRQDRIHGILVSLEEQVEQKTESLRLALEEARKANELMVHMADHDVLTGLMNRRRFQKELEQWIEYATRYNRKGTLLFIDLDRFKHVNDTHGHSAGDQYLSSVATLLTKTLRSTDLVARWGGDEFAAFLPETIGVEAHSVGNKLLDTLAKAKFEFNGVAFQPSASIGLAFMPDHTVDASELIIFADAAMYEAKKAGRGCWRLYAASEAEIQYIQEHLHWETRIRRALENDQFLLLYQPLVKLSNEHTEGYEALLRMEDTGGQLITPGQFLESADRSNLSAAIDLMVIRKALRRISPVGARHDLGVWVSVNLSPKTLHDANLVPQIEMLVKEYAVHQAKLRFEIPELTVLQNMNLTREIGIQIKALGCAFILDDFGLGAPSFPYIEQLGFSMVKCHPNLLREIADDKEKQGRLKILLATLHEMKLSVAAKSVEDIRILPLLRELGFDYVQGFAIGKPLESIEVALDASVI